MTAPFTVASFADERPAGFLDNILFGQITERRVEVDRLALLFPHGQPMPWTPGHPLT
jgi:hypothetical protein